VKEISERIPIQGGDWGTISPNYSIKMIGGILCSHFAGCERLEVWSRGCQEAR